MGGIHLGRIIKNGCLNFWRNHWLSLTATTVMTITLLIFGILAILFSVTSTSVQAIRGRVDISIYFKTGVAESLIEQYSQQLKQNSRIAEVNYSSAENALASFKRQHKNDPLILESLDELSENPLPATLQIKALALEDYPQLAEEIKTGPLALQIRKVNFEDNQLLIARLNKILKTITYAGSGLAATFSIIAILVMFNTITLTIYNRREEVEIMRLVGATNGYIRGPFLVEAFLYSIVAASITSAALWIGLKSIKNPLITYLNALSGQENPINLGPFMDTGVLAACMLIIALILSSIASSWAIRKYLRI